MCSHKSLMDDQKYFMCNYGQYCFYSENVEYLYRKYLKNIKYKKNYK